MGYFEAANEFIEDIEAVNEWAEEVYQKHFQSHFVEQQELYKRVKSVSNPITDAELEEILTNLPLELFTVSESLSKFKTSIEVMKLRMKEKQADVMKDSIEKTITAKQQEAELATIEESLVITVYKGIVSRVQNEMDFSRELIMSAKKIYDSRRQAESAMPVSPIEEKETLPEYNGDFSGKTYVG